MITPQKAPVRPRIRSPETGELVLLEDFVELCAQEGKATAIELFGARKSGKTTALAHLASLPIAESLYLVDDPGRLDVNAGGPDRIVVYAVRERLNLGSLVCPLAAHFRRCDAILFSRAS